MAGQPRLAGGGEYLEGELVGSFVGASGGLAVRCRPLTHKLVFDLVGSYPRGCRPTVPLARIAKEIGIQT